MFKKLSQKISMLLLCLSLLIFNSAPAFASTNVNNSVKDIPKVSLASNTDLVDGSSCKQTISGGNIGIFNVQVQDGDLRNLFVASSVPVKTIIMPDSTGLQNFISFTSGEYRMFNAIGWRFIPGAQYRVFVIPQSTAEVTVSMSKSSSVLTWVTMGNSEITEKNMLMGGLTDQYGIAFKSSGTYRITVSTVSKLTAVFSDAITPSQSKVVQLSNNSYVFDNLKINATGEVQNNYGIILTGNDPVNNGGAYTVKIERLY